MNQSTQYIIVGQGIGGTMVSYFLHKAGLNFIVIDPALPSNASRVAGGIINPVTGKKLAKSWRIDELQPFALKTYQEIGDLLGKELVLQTRVHRYHSNPEDATKFDEQAETQDWFDDYILPLQVDEPAINNTLGGFTISPALKIYGTDLMDGWREYLKQQGRFFQDTFNHTQLEILPSSIRYKDIKAQKVIFCEGWGVQHNPWFKDLPFNAAKGEALIVKIEGLLPDEVYLKGVFLVPLGNDLYYIGSTNEWVFADDKPSEHKREELERKLQKALNLPYEVLEHRAAVRPAVKNRRPLIGPHPAHNQLWLFNGLGTKGYSLSPFFANQLIMDLQGSGSLDEEVKLTSKR
jgi:glycine/D-amino acid oxidase-like deaminating enzyme